MSRFSFSRGDVVNSTFDGKFFSVLDVTYHGVILNDYANGEVRFLDVDDMYLSSLECNTSNPKTTNNPVSSPNYYVMPNGQEVIGISQWLSSAGAQAMQYIVRATRLDGIVKDNPVQDLEKAQLWLKVEIERLKGIGDER